MSVLKQEISVANTCPAVQTRNSAVMLKGLEPFFGLRDDFAELNETLADIAEIGGRDVARQVKKLTSEIAEFAPAITFIGQIKAGKTSLVNAIAGRPGLLPTDVNPWTSVVTSLHLEHVRGPEDPVAEFTFFDEDEWDKLIAGGGRIGELSARAGADKEHAKLVAQVQQMREKTKERLGRKFEMLLGQTRRYQAIEKGLIEKYVCLGDDFDEGHLAAGQGQFADITKSAELYLDAPNLPIPLTLRDTPGMNDTFLMREQITIRAIRESRICVVVLSAHQALNTVDMGLIRMIANVRSRQVIIFVNRADELARPHEQIPEIEQSLRTTLKKNGAPDEIEIIFGSALWANAALNREVDKLPESSLAALEEFSGLSGAPEVSDINPEGTAWIQSGVPRLFETMGDRIQEGPATKLLDNVCRRAGNMLEGLKATSSLVNLRASSDQLQKLSNQEVNVLMQRIADTAHGRLSDTLESVFGTFDSRIEQAHARYVSRALDSLLQHLEKKGETQVWNYSADGLRMLMRSNYQVMLSKLRKEVGAVLGETAQALTEAYSEIFDVEEHNFVVRAPEFADLPAPVGIAQTIVLDVQGSWWRRWWSKRRGYAAFADNFKEMIEAETAPMLEDLKITQVNEIRAIAVAMLDSFLDDQCRILKDICEKTNLDIEDLNTLYDVNSQRKRAEMYDILAAELNLEPIERVA